MTGNETQESPLYLDICLLWITCHAHQWDLGAAQRTFICLAKRLMGRFGLHVWNSRDYSHGLQLSRSLRRACLRGITLASYSRLLAPQEGELAESFADGYLFPSASDWQKKGQLSEKPKSLTKKKWRRVKLWGEVEECPEKRKCRNFNVSWTQRESKWMRYFYKYFRAKNLRTHIKQMT